jgi:hypothetical protein
MRKVFKVGLYTVAGLLVFSFGAGAGAAGKTAPVAATPVPGPTVTVTSQPAPAVTVTPQPLPAVTVTAPVEKIVERTPQSCITALERAGSAMGLSSELADQLLKGMNAAYLHDAEGMGAVTAELKGLNAKMEAAKGPLAIASAQCRASR